MYDFAEYEYYDFQDEREQAWDTCGDERDFDDDGQLSEYEEWHMDWNHGNMTNILILRIIDGTGNIRRIHGGSLGNWGNPGSFDGS